MSISRSASSCLTSVTHGVVSAPPDESCEIVGGSAAMRRLRLQVRRIAPHFRTVLVSGEAGTGKELVARTLHAMSSVGSGPFVVCHGGRMEDARAIDDLMRGAQRGTLFLDEIDKMPWEAQGRLLRALEDHESAPSPLETAQRMDQRLGLRVIVSTCEDLKILASTGRFRQELYQRLATVDISLPPLRERMEDLPALARYFLDRSAMACGRCVHEIADEAIERMQRYCWPGNVHELENVLRNGVLQSEGAVLEAHHLPVFAESSGPVSATLIAHESVRLQDVMQRHVLGVLKDCRGNKLRAAEKLGISRSTLYRMLESCSPLEALRS